MPATRFSVLWRRVVVALLAGAACAATAQPVPEAVTLPSADGSTLKAWLFKPAGDAKATVVALHGCGGLYATTGPRRGLLNARHQAMAELLVGQGYAVLFPDSLTPRGEHEICTQKAGERKITQNERRADALGALTWTAGQPWANGKVALLGWSHGGSAVLEATDARRRDVMTVPEAARPAVAVAFYPGCAAAARGSWRANTPVHILIGALDDWTPAAPCEQLGREGRALVTVYPDSYHDFDNPVGEVRLRRDVPHGVNPGQGVHAGRNPAAREQAYAKLVALLATAFAVPQR